MKQIRQFLFNSDLILDESIRQRLNPVLSLMEVALEGVHILDEQGNVLVANSAFCNVLGYTQDEILNLNVTDWDVDLSSEELTDRFSKLLEGRSTFETLNKRKDGSVIEVEVNAVGVRLNGRKYLYATSKDITHRKRIEKGMMLKEQYQRALLDNFPYPVWLKDKESNFLVVNKEFANVFGADSPDEFTGKSDYEFAPRELAERYRTDDKEVRDTLRKKLVEEPIATNSGLRLFETHKSPVMDSNGKLLGTVGFARDITESKLAEAKLAEAESNRFTLLETLRESELFVRTVTDNLPGMLSYWTPDLLCRFTNKGCLTWFGWHAEEMQNIHIREFFGEDMYRQNEPFIRKVLLGEESMFEGMLFKPDGKIGQMLSHYIPHTVEDEVKGFFVLATDITKIKQAEARARAAEKTAEVQVGMIQQLKNYSKDLDTTLSTLIKHKEDIAHSDKIALSQEIEKLIVPFMRELRKNTSTVKQEKLISVIETNMQQLVSSYGKTKEFSTRTRKLTPKETQIASLIRQGISSKEIASTLSLSLDTINNHRKNIRKKLGLESRSENLQSWLDSLHD